MRRIVAVDFDGTCVRHEYPEVGADVCGAVDVLRRLVANDCRLILWTMRSGSELADAVRWFEDREIPLFGVNANPEQATWTASPKAYAQIYIDDAALGCPLIARTDDNGRDFVNWDVVAESLLIKGFL